MLSAFSRLHIISCLLAATLLLEGCGGSGPVHKPPVAGGANYKVGTPYEISGTWYYPKEDYSYDATGIASWYGADFHGGKTANGEIYNKDELTAAHTTLPMPSLARVTNLDNGRSVVVRINDRGPFKHSRLIDVSQRAAQLLGFEKQGTAKVRVQVLADESKAIADAMRRYGGPSTAPVTVASTEAQPGVAAAPRSAVMAQELEPVSNTVQTAPKPTLTTPQIHEELVETRPVAEAVQVPVPATSDIYVQAGAFKVLENANRLKQNLSSIGQVQVSSAVVHGDTFYRVRIGPIASVAKADVILAKTAQAGVEKARIIVD
ncbi:MAG: septal ring lytic transglycosylase RlpA family protein [Bdellovibrionales bacterium]